MPQFSIQTAFAAGEIAPALYGHVDLAKIHVAATTMRNGFVSYRGGYCSRAGTALCNRSRQTYAQAPPRLIKFQFNINQGYALELGDNYMRVYAHGAPVVEAAKTITGTSNTNPCGIAAVNNFANGDWVVIEGVGGTTQLNGGTYIVASASSGYFTLEDLNGNSVNATSYGVYTSGGTVARIYTLATPWAAGDLPYLKTTQSADVMTLCCVNTVNGAEYPPYDLARVTASDWVLTQSTFAANIVAPANAGASATVQPSTATSPPTLPAAYAYCVTAVEVVTGEESVASPIANLTNGVDIAATAGSNIVSWSAVANAATYNIYKAPTSYNTDPGNPTDALPVPAGAVFGYCGTSYGTQFVDSNTIPDVTTVPPQHTDPFARGAVLYCSITSGGAGYTSATTVTITSGTGSGFIAGPVIISGVIQAVLIMSAGQNFSGTDTLVFTDSGGGTGATGTLTLGPPTGTWPSVPAYTQQRRVYAGSLNDPDTLWMSQAGNFLNFDTSIPITANDAITATPWSQQVNGIQFMIPMPGGLVVLTGLGAWQIGGSGSSATNPQPITPTSIQATQQAFNGCSDIVPPLTVNFDIIYVQAKGSIVRDLAWNFWINIYTGSDLTQLSGQLFAGFQILQSAWCEEPYKIAWFIRNDGVLLSLTYLKEQEVYGWARHDTFGQFLSIASVTEPPVDALYVAVARPCVAAAGGTAYYIERMDNRIWAATEDPWCVDCGLSNPMPAPNAILYANSASGVVIFNASSPVFSSGNIGSVIRMGGGIATISGYISTSSVNGTWNLPPVALFPDVTPRVIQQPPGSWTMTAPIDAVGGLTHLAGLTVTGIADGVPIPPTVVSGTGTIPLPYFASNVKVGLPFTPQLQLPRLDPAGQMTLQGRRKTVTALTARVDASISVAVGSNQPDGAALSPPSLAPAWSGMVTTPNQGSTYVSPGGVTVQELFTGDIRTTIMSTWAKPGQVAFQQTAPLPLNIVDVVPEYLEGDLPELTFSQRQQRQQVPRGPGNWMISG